MHGQRRKSHVDSTLFTMRLHMIRNKERDKSKQSTTRRICPPPLSSLSFPAGPHWQARAAEDGTLHYNKAGYKVLEKVEDKGWDIHKGRKQWKTFCNRPTGPQLRAKNSKTWQNPVTPPKARHLKPLVMYFRLNWGRWRMPRENRKPCSST